MLRLVVSHQRKFRSWYAIIAVDGGPIALVAEGDRIVVDVRAHSIELAVDQAELAERRRNLEPFQPRYETGFLAKYAALAQGAEKGAVTQA